MSARLVEVGVTAGVDWQRWLRPDDRIVVSHMSAEPVALLESLAAAGLPDLPLHLMLGVPFTQAAASLPAACALLTFGGLGSGAALAASRPVQISPLPYGRSEAVYRERTWRCDVALVSLGRDADGALVLGASHGPVLAAAGSARHVIAQVSDAVPCIGERWPAALPIAALVETDAGPPALDPPPTGTLDVAIARRVAALVPDGACLQVGIGAMPSAALAELASHRHLGVHSGMMTDALYRLVEAGAVDHSRKTVDAGVAVVGSVCGSAALYRAVHRDPAIRLREPSYTHAAAVIASLRDVFCLNSALEVDLLGNVNAEALVAADGRWRFVGGVGGLPDFARAALQAHGGQAVVALASRTLRQRPRIVAQLAGPCTLAACDADWVVTEHGAARLRDRSIAERVRRMVAIAHPEDRDGLTAAARIRGLV